MEFTPNSLRETRDSASEAYLCFTLCKGKFPDMFYAFYEGKDAPFYSPIIRDWSRREVMPIKCLNKKKVTQVYDKLQQETDFEKYITGFFVDRDYDLNTDLEVKDIFITKGYAIENYCTTCSAFRRILTDLFDFNYSEPEFNYYVEEYTSMQNQYNQGLLRFNGWYCALRRKHGDQMGHLSLDNKKRKKKYIQIDFENGTVGCSMTDEDFYEEFPDAERLTEDEIQKGIEYIRADMPMNIRGKYEMDFLTQYLEYLKKKMKSLEQQDKEMKKHKCNIQFSLDSGIVALAPYADRDDEQLHHYITRRCGITNFQSRA